MDLIPIGEAASKLGLTPSALRYYDERALVRPAARRHRTRMYGSNELRRLAFLQLAGRLGIPLETAACVLDQPGERWRRDAACRIADLDDLIRRARGAQSLLQNAIDCPEEHPMTDCTSFTATLDDLVDGKTFDDLSDEHAPDGSGAVTRSPAR